MLDMGSYLCQCVSRLTWQVQWLTSKSRHIMMAILRLIPLPGSQILYASLL